MITFQSYFHSSMLSELAEATTSLLVTKYGHYYIMRQRGSSSRRVGVEWPNGWAEEYLQQYYSTWFICANKAKICAEYEIIADRCGEAVAQDEEGRGQRQVGRGTPPLVRSLAGRRPLQIGYVNFEEDMPAGGIQLTNGPTLSSIPSEWLGHGTVIIIIS